MSEWVSLYALTSNILYIYFLRPTCDDYDELERGKCYKNIFFPMILWEEKKIRMNVCVSFKKFPHIRCLLFIYNIALSIQINDKKEWDIKAMY